MRGSLPFSAPSYQAPGLDEGQIFNKMYLLLMVFIKFTTSLLASHSPYMTRKGGTLKRKGECLRIDIIHCGMVLLIVQLGGGQFQVLCL